MSNEKLRKAGLKVTIPRLKILEILEANSDQHMKAEDVYKILIQQDSDIGLATVYRVLTQFETAKIVTRHHFEGGHSVFELNQGGHHDHLICIDCGKVFEFFNEEIEKIQHQVATDEGFTLKSHSHNIYGECNKINCKNKPD
ncbi:MAG: ferric iron uptake transcriptional regulator [Methylococcales bacterium]|jgi:Fur family transcriptional regulator, ferric uptake regulator|nr:ferric iron uptake transcriptional regulator [Methylococcales bacterium]MBT7408536.1 ferric iron uptake transcriptional regulator [Methylococcales bacterium]